MDLMISSRNSHIVPSLAFFIISLCVVSACSMTSLCLCSILCCWASSLWCVTCAFFSNTSNFWMMLFLMFDCPCHISTQMNASQSSEMKRMRKVDIILVNSFSPFWFPQCCWIVPPGPTFTVVWLVCMDSSVFELSVISALALKCGFVTGISTLAILHHLQKILLCLTWLYVFAFAIVKLYLPIQCVNLGSVLIKRCDKVINKFCS